MRAVQVFRETLIRSGTKLQRTNAGSSYHQSAVFGASHQSQYSTLVSSQVLKDHSVSSVFVRRGNFHQKGIRLLSANSSGNSNSNGEKHKHNRAIDSKSSEKNQGKVVQYERRAPRQNHENGNQQQKRDGNRQPQHRKGGGNQHYKRQNDGGQQQHYKRQNDGGQQQHYKRQNDGGQQQHYKRQNDGGQQQQQSGGQYKRQHGQNKGTRQHQGGYRRKSGNEHGDGQTGNSQKRNHYRSKAQDHGGKQKQQYYRKGQRQTKQSQKPPAPVLSDLDILLGRVAPQPSASQQDSSKSGAQNKHNKKKAQQKEEDDDQVREVVLPETMGLRWLSEASGLEVSRILFTVAKVHSGGLRDIGDEFSVASSGVGYRMGMSPLSPKSLQLLEDASRNKSRQGRHDVRKAVQQAAESLILSQEVAALVLLEWDILAEFQSEVDLDLRPSQLPPPGPEYDSLPLRAPIVTVMGHVDHGKTTLLDTLRHSNVAAGESGGITQAVGAFNVALGEDRVVFVDTPGHAAFSSMRQSGAAVTDIVVLVVAATDGLRPQTLESIEIAKAAGVPLVVALTKVDMPGVDADTAAYTVAADLQLAGVDTEIVGGEVPLVPVAAPVGRGLAELTEALLMQAEALELRAPREAPGEAVVLETFADRHRGMLVDAVVRSGTLRPGDVVVAGSHHAKVRQLLDPVTLVALDAAPPATPVRVVGLKEAVAAGSHVLCVEDERRAKEVSEFRSRKEKFSQLLSVDKKVSRTREKLRLARLARKEEEEEGEEGREEEEDLGETVDPVIVPVVVKADTSGSLAALEHSIHGLSLQLSETEEDELERLTNSSSKPTMKGELPLLPFGSEIRIVRSGVGPITKQDIDAAATAGCHVFGFNVRAPASVDREANLAHVNITTQNVIYHLLDDLKKVFMGHMAAVIDVKVTGSATVAQVFDMNTKRGSTWRVAGCQVNSGEVSKSQRVRVVRDGEVIHNSSGIDSLKVFKENKKVVNSGQECGISLTGFQDFKEGDVIESYEEVEVTFN